MRFLLFENFLLFSFEDFVLLIFQMVETLQLSSLAAKKAFRLARLVDKLVEWRVEAYTSELEFVYF